MRALRQAERSPTRASSNIRHTMRRWDDLGPPYALRPPPELVGCGWAAWLPCPLLPHPLLSPLPNTPTTTERRRHCSRPPPTQNTHHDLGGGDQQRQRHQLARQQHETQLPVRLLVHFLLCFLHFVIGRPGGARACPTATRRRGHLRVRGAGPVQYIHRHHLGLAGHPGHQRWVVW